MANRKDLKKSIQMITSELVTECYIAHGMLEKFDDKQFKEILERIVCVNNDFLSRVNHPEPGRKAKEYYKVLCKDFDAKVAEIIEILNKK